ncbi:Exon junction complex, Pym [Niveomyces insectorum RCEF 264]|uniref:Exon junction complex, Pym n=1 Tax=Niveomyces insectorum RCEF 264 TaxID=1081102 RepID=A0A168AER3_9HYPO|nr:Exon junction complex, Pym [Niveomyces insectorum RCEF 264]
MSSQPTTAGIITDKSGERHIPESTRADGSTRKAIKIRPGYQPPEDVALYKNRTAESFRNRYKGGVPGAEALKAEIGQAGPSSGTGPGAGTGDGAAGSGNKNAKRREARKRAAAAAAAVADTASTGNDAGGRAVPGPTTATTNTAAPATAATSAPTTEIDPEAEREKKARGLRKKLKQAKELKNKRDGGEALLPEQIAKVIRINELIRELEALGLDAEGEPKTAAEKDGGKTT